MFRPHYDRHLINTLLGRNRKITEDDCYMLERPYMNAVDLEILPRLAPTVLSSTRHSSPPLLPPPSSSSVCSKFNHDLEDETVYLPDRNATGVTPAGLTDMIDTEALLRLKWMDNTPRMSRLRESRRRRLINKLEQYELWDQEQEQKNRQHELAREQRYKNIMDRLKSQEFCVNQMKKRHESDLETTRELENYSNDHLYFDCLDDPKTFYKGPVSQYRQFSNEMEEKVKTLINDLDTLNPRHTINQAILPRIERTREIYSIEPEVFTRSGRRVLKRPKLDRTSSSRVASGGIDDTAGSSRRSTSGDAERLGSATSLLGPASASERFLSESQRRLRNILQDTGSSPKSSSLKPIIHTPTSTSTTTTVDDAVKSIGKMSLVDPSTADKKAVYFNDTVEYRSPPTTVNED